MKRGLSAHRELFRGSIRAAVRGASPVALKLIGVVFAVLILVIAVQAFLGARLGLRAIETEEREKLGASYQGYRDEIGLLERESAALATMSADRPLFQRLVAAQDRTGLLTLLAPLYAVLREKYYISHLSIHRPNGFVLLRVQDPVHYGDSLRSYRRTVTEVMDRREPVSGVELDSDRLGIRGIAPVFLTGQFVGMVEVGLNYDRAFLADMKSRTGQDYRIWLTYQAAAPTGFWPSGTEPAAPSAELFFYASTTDVRLSLPASAYRQTLASRGGRVLFVDSKKGSLAVLLAPLTGFGGSAIGVVEIIASREEALGRLRANLAATVSAAAVLAAISMVLMAIAIGLVVLRPLYLLAEVTHRWIEGDHAARVDFLPRDEFGELGGAFNRMQDQADSYVHDLQDRMEAIRSAEKARDASEATNRALFAATPDAIFRMDGEGRLTDYLPGKSFPAMGERDFIGRKATDMVPSKLGEDLDRHVQEVLKSGNAENFEIALPVGGETRQLEVRLVAAGGFGLLGIVRDIGERVRMEKERERLTTQLLQAQKMESIGRLAGGVAHDFNNLLTPILGYASLLTSNDLASMKPAALASEILSAGNRAKELVSQLLAFSRKQVLETKVADLNAIIEDFRRILRSTIRENIDIRVTGAADLWPVRADRSQIEQILMNLAVNSQDAMPNGGMILIETRNETLEAGPALPQSDARPGDYASLVFRDTGRGIAGDVMAHVFEPFFTTKSEGMGTGLGLATVFGIVKQHGGTVSVSSEEGRGTTFRILLPRAPGDLQRAQPVLPEQGNRIGNKTLLLVEDMEPIRRMLSMTLGLKGYQVLEAADGPSALRAAEEYEGPIHALVTDIIMPGMNGVELFIRLVEKRPAVKVVYMSGYTDSILTDYGIVRDERNFIQKPFTTGDLVQVLSRTFNGSK